MKNMAQIIAIAVLLSQVLLPSNSFAAAPSEDPLESVNRVTFEFNRITDRWFLRPIAKTYSVLAPDFVQRGIGNALRNLRDVNYAVNAALQGRFSDAGKNTARVAVNSTVGLGGLFDVATRSGIHGERADFGQTLAALRIPSGPYIVIPLLGPSTVRDGIGFGVDAVALSVPSHISSSDARLAIWGTAFVHARAGLLSTDELLTGDRYVFMREAYLQRRERFLEGDKADGVSDFDDFSDFEDFHSFG